MLRLLSLLSVAVAAPTTIMMEQDRLGALPPGWSVVGASPRETELELVFAVKQTNLGALEQELLRVSDPSSATYGQHLTSEQVHALVAPRASHLRAVHAFLALHGLNGTAFTPNSDWIGVTCTVAQAEAMLAATPGATYMQLNHTSGKVIHRLRGGYTLPAPVAEAVDLVAPTVHVPTLRAREIGEPVPAEALEMVRALRSSVGAPEGLFNTPKSLKALYSVKQVQGSKGEHKQAVTGFIGQTYAEKSLAAFYRDFCKDGVPCGENKDATKVSCKGDACAGAGGTESMLDIEYINALGAGVVTEFWGFSGSNPYAKQDEPFLKWLYTVGNATDKDVPKLFSTSYGEDEDIIPLAWSTRTQAEFQKAGARGISLLFASGDSGAAGDNGCKGGKFVPQWPSGNPWVTAVGGTQGQSESAAGLSSGGFSNRWDRPAYQTEAVASYLSNKGSNMPSATKYNATGAGFPDISAQAVNFIIVQGGFPVPGVSGTSCASPTAAGIFGLLNDLRASKGKAPLGFLNPLIYKNTAAFNDITTGVNNGCDFSGGFPAAKGWDAATGVGTPDYEKLAAVVSKLP